jgi:hypothetical protein
VKGAWRVVLLYAALTAILAYPLTIRPASTMLADDPDAHLFLWTLGWDAHAFLHQPFSIFDANIYHPQRFTLAYSENLIGSALIAAPVIWLTGNHVLALNVVVLLSCVLCGLGTYLLLRKLGVGVVGATLAGLVFAFSPIRFYRLSQLHLGTVQWVPFTLAYLHAYLDGGRRRDLRLAVAFFTLQALTTGHGAVFASLSVSLLLTYRVLFGEPIALTGRLRDFGATGALILVPAALIYLPYRAVQSELGMQRPLDIGTPLPESFLASPTMVHTYLHSFLRAGPHINETASAFLFPGYTPILLGAVALLWFARRPPGEAPPWPLRGGMRAIRQWAAARRVDARSFYGLLAAFCVAMSVAPPYGLWPYFYRMPGFSLVRVQSRFMILALLGVAVLAGLGFDHLFERRTKWVRRTAGGLLGLLMVVEFAGVPLQTHPFKVPTTGAEQWLETQPKPFVVAELPWAQRERYQTIYMMHSMTHWQKTVQGYSGMQAGLHTELYRQMRFFPDEPSLSRLSDLGVTHIVVHRKMYPDDVWEEIRGYLNDFGAWLTLVHEEDEERVYRLHRPQ